MNDIDTATRKIRRLCFEVQERMDDITAESEDVEVCETIEEASQNIVSILNGLQSELTLINIGLL